MNLLTCTQKVDINDPILGFFHRWIEEFAQFVDELHVICLEEGEHDLPDNVYVYTLGKGSGESRVKYVVNFYRYIWNLRSKYDSVFVHMNPEYVVLGGLLWHVMKKKIGLWYTHKSVDLKLRIAEKLSHIIFTASEKSFRLKSRKVEVVGHGIDTELFKPESTKGDKNTLTMLTVGRISLTKNLHILIDHFAEFQSENKKLVIVGEPGTQDEKNYKEQLLRQISDYGLKESVSFPGAKTQKEIVSYYQSADVCVNLSNTGSLDKAVLESILTHTAVVTSNEAFGSLLNPYGLYVSSESEFNKCLSNALSLDGSSREELREHLIEKHSLSALIPRILSLYEKTS